jgi:arsenate reductase
MPKKVLVLCTGNSCRSQMAEAFWNSLGEGAWHAVSAGSDPAGYVHPMAIAAMGEVGIDISANKSKHVDQFVGEPFDVVLTVCSNAQANCPVFPGSVEALHWPFDDPAYATGTEEEKMAAFRAIRDQIRATIRDYLREM